MNAVSCGYIFKKVPFFKLTFLRITSEPSSRKRLCISQTGKWQTPSSAENSNTPQYDFFEFCGLLIMKVIGYEIFNLANSARADDGMIILFPLLTSGFPMNAGE